MGTTAKKTPAPKPKGPPKGGFKPRARKRTGRPKAVETDDLGELPEGFMKKLANAAGLGCTVEEAGAVLGMSKSTLLRIFKRHPKAKEQWDMGQLLGNVSVRRKQFKLADTSAQMAIHLGKHRLGQHDKVTLGPDGDGGAAVVIFKLPDNGRD